ncbi:MAG: 2-hydroxyacyl-CoA dehydratase family protein [candidate division KSB1 bacterium]|nr:2-hydroxyacyl-CoA dehydratase family protein [candidate division KSB1 bacterium]
MELAGAAVVWDDLCVGSRYFQGLIDENADPIEAIAKRYFERVICPAKYRDPNFRGEYLARIAREKNIHGAIFVMLKFCDPHAFDYPFLKDHLDQVGIPSLRLEIEDPQLAIGQLQTRIEAFVEML